MMSEKSRQTGRKLAALLIAILLYYVIHEGAHLLYALAVGAFKQINRIGVGIQIETYKGVMSDVQTAYFCLAGAGAALVSGWLLIFMMPKILKCRSLLFRAAAFYTTLVFLLNDPFYLSFFYQYVGGGDMNGIRLLIPEGYARAVFGVIMIAHIIVIIKYIVPNYRNAFVSQQRDFLQ